LEEDESLDEGAETVISTGGETVADPVSGVEELVPED
jgi:hypothetical protein